MGRSCSSSRSRSRSSSSPRRRSSRSSHSLTELAAQIAGRRLRVGDAALQVVAGTAAAAATVLVGLIVWKVTDGAWPAVRHYGVSFVWTNQWNPVAGREVYGAASFLF